MIPKECVKELRTQRRPCVGLRRGGRWRPLSAVCFDGERPASDSDCMEARIPAGDILETPTGVRMARSGGLTIKRENNIMNLYGAMGDVNLILGRYALSEKKL